MKLIPVILCGGAGSRLWPVSREQHPKPFITLPDGQSLLQKAFARGTLMPQVAEVLVVTNYELLFKIADELAAINSARLPLNFVLEPFARNTAPAVAAAAFEVAERHGPDAFMLVLAADHLINDQEAFKSACNRAIELADEDRLVVFGIKPCAPETGYGYIKAEGEKVLAFVEKPSFELAEEYVASTNYFWNAGLFCFKAGVILDELQRHSPQVYEAIANCRQISEHKRNKDYGQLNLNFEVFLKAPNISLDYAVMEKSSNIAMVNAGFDWNDIGSWQALSQFTPADEQGNRVDAQVVMKDVSNCFIKSDNRVVGLVGVEDLLVVDTPDALLVADKTRAQEIKDIYDQLKKDEHPAYKQHRTVIRPWGQYIVLEEGPGFKIKRIEVKPGASLSLQMHRHRSEHWIVVAGTAKVVNGEEELLVGTNQSTYIPATHKHRLENPGAVPLVIIEVQSGHYLEEDDIIRLDDSYGRNC